MPELLVPCKYIKILYKMIIEKKIICYFREYSSHKLKKFRKKKSKGLGI